LKYRKIYFLFQFLYGTFGKTDYFTIYFIVNWARIFNYFRTCIVTQPSV